MKKLLMASAALLLCFIAVSCSKTGTKPFADLTADEISSVSVNCMPPDKTVHTSDEENIESLVKILNKVVIYEEDEKEYAGQSVAFTINKTDGTQIKVTAYNPQMIIDGVKYVTKYDPCEDLNALGNQWVEEMPSSHKTLEEIKQLLASYPSDYESVLNSGCYVVSNGKAVSGQDLFDDFANNADNGIPDDITIVNFTMEGDPIYSYVYYDGKTFSCITDSSRDRYGGWEQDEAGGNAGNGENGGNAGNSGNAENGEGAAVKDNYDQYEYKYMINSLEGGVSYTFLSDEQGVPFLQSADGSGDPGENSRLLLFSLRADTYAGPDMNGDIPETTEGVAGAIQDNG